MSKLRSLGVAAVFLAGCAVGGVSNRIAVRPAMAQQPETRAKWEYFCMMTSPDPTEMAARANWAGAQGWELAVEVSGYNSPHLCFKRPKI
jgi:hypothetical protein